jgi:hypothetical protein
MPATGGMVVRGIEEDERDTREEENRSAYESSFIFLIKKTDVFIYF